MSYRCPWNRALRCGITAKAVREVICPIQDSLFLDALIIWANTGRTPKGVSWDAVKGTSISEDYRQLIKARIYRLFINGSMVLDVMQENFLMSTGVCSDLIQAKPKWEKMRWREKYGQ